MRKTDRLDIRWKRTNRIVDIDRYWYFHTREYGLLGPYDSIESAAKGIDSYLLLLNQHQVALDNSLSSTS